MNLRWLLTFIYTAVLVAAALHNPGDLAAKIVIGLQLLYYSKLLMTKSLQNGIGSNRLLLLVIWLTLLILITSLTMRVVCRDGTNSYCP